MSSQASSTWAEPVTGPGVHYSTFIGLVWTGTALSTLSITFRLISRWLVTRRIYWDDVCAVFAAILVLITACLWQWAAEDIYYILNLAAGLVPLEADFLERLFRGLRASLIVELFFYTSLFLVKLSFLLFFRRLGSNVRGQKSIWWPAFALSVICYLVSIGDVEYKCLVNSSALYIQTYCTSDDAIYFTTTTLIVNCVLDVLSDFTIMLIPIALLWNVRIQRQKKIAFIGLFSLSLITIAVAIARTADLNVTKKASGQQDSSYLWMWSAIQSSLAVIVSCLSAFPQLFKASSHQPKPQWTPTDTYYQRLRSRMKERSKRSLDPLYDTSALTMPGLDVEANSHESERPVLNLEGKQQTAQCSGGPPERPVQQSHIVRQLEYQVIQQPAEAWHEPSQPQHAYAYTYQPSESWVTLQHGNAQYLSGQVRQEHAEPRSC